MSENFTIKNKHFEGPLDLLLELIEKQKLDVTKLSIVEVADEYLEYVDSRENVDLANLSEFLLIASQLILLKSKALLPLFEFSQEEEEEIEDLEERLREYQRFKKAASDIKTLLEGKKVSFSREEEKVQRISFVMEKVPPGELKKLFCGALQSMPTKEELAKQVMEEVVSIEEKISQLKNSIEERMRVAFHETVQEAGSKIDVIVTFLAMLEMVKQQLVTVSQGELFSDIIMEKKVEGEITQQKNE